MDALSRGFDPARPRFGPLLPGAPAIALGASALGLASLAMLEAGGPAAAPGRALGAVAFHGGLLAASLAAAWEGAPGWRLPALLTALAAGLGAAAGGLGAWGAAAALLLPLGLAALALRHPECRRMGLCGPADARALALGAAVGGFLGGHLLLSASRTFDYPVRLDPPSAFLSGVLYDVGANVLSAECFFRGTLFNRWQRRRGFWPAALGSTALALVRYLLDPALPPALELVAGAVFYLALLSLAGCALLWASGSLLPGAAAALLFFTAYRLLKVG
jgi:hypothetical protein